MTVLPIVARELRVAARRKAGYWNRVVAALLALALGAIVYANLASQSLADLGFALFISLAWLAFVFCLLAGARLAADTISEERREGTLGLLFLTDLKGHDIVLGKLAASSVSALYSLLAIVPVLSLTLLFGGVSGTQLGQVVLVLGNTLFFSLALGLCVSTWFENGRRAAAVTVLLMGVITIGPGLLVAAIEAGRSGGPSEATAAMLLVSPAIALGLAAIPAAPAPIAGLYWPSVASTFLLAILSLVTSSLVVPRIWHDRPSSARRLAWRRWREKLVYGAAGVRQAFRARLLGLNPFFWITSRDRLRPWYVWALLGAVAVAWGAGRARFGRDWEDSGVLLFFSQCVYGLLKLWIAAAVVMRLAEDRRSAALELILTTPLSVRDIRRGLLSSLRRQFQGPLLGVIAIDLFCAWIAAGQLYSDRDMVLAMYAARLTLLVLDVATLWALGPWVAVTAKHPNQAAANLLVRVCVVPWLLFLALAFLLALADQGHWFQVRVSELGAIGGWFLLGLANDVFWLQYAAVKMRRHFRSAAASRFEQRGGWWRSLWRMN